MKDDDLACCIVDRIKENERISHDRQNSHAWLIGLVPNAREFCSSAASSSMRFTTEPAADRLRS
jgi:hypothetical protein